MPTVRRAKPWVQKPPIGARLNLAHPLCAGLQSYVVFNEGVGPPNDLVLQTSWALTGAPPWVQGDNPIGGGQSFDGSTQHLALSSSAYLTITTGTSFAIEAWFTLGVNPLTDVFIVAKTDASEATGWGFGVESNGGSPSPMIIICDGGYEDSGGVADVTLNTLHHGVGVMTWNGTQYSGDVYLDGVLVSGTGSPSTTLTDTGTAALIAQQNPGSSHLFQGNIYQVAVRTGTLTAGDVASLYANPWQVFSPAKGAWLFPSAGAAAPSFLLPYNRFARNHIPSRWA
jgi:Concanavalin A-like lectin/glucanases superfamily